MKQKHPLQRLKEQCPGKEVFNTQILTDIAAENLWNIWVPKTYGGLELSFTEGLHKLQELARIDGSLGWTVTLCSGANYFIGNLPKQTADALFLNPQQPVCFGGSGGLFGTAEKKGNSYKLKGTWRYGTGAPYLTHFTLNAKITKNGKELINDDGTPKFRSFVVPAEEVNIIDDWHTMGLKATATCSFEVNDVMVSEASSFIYNEFQLPQSIFKINFSVFADLTLWVNYIGMAEHLLAEVTSLLPKEDLHHLRTLIAQANLHVAHFANEINEITQAETPFSEDFLKKVHNTACASVKDISKAIIEIHPLLGVKAARSNHPINQIFCDYFTGTQHHIFSRK